MIIGFALESEEPIMHCLVVQNAGRIISRAKMPHSRVGTRQSGEIVKQDSDSRNRVANA